MKILDTVIKPHEQIEAMLTAWRSKLEDLEAKYLEAEKLSPFDKPFVLASLKLQERLILENIAELSTQARKSNA